MIQRKARQNQQHLVEPIPLEECQNPKPLVEPIPLESGKEKCPICGTVQRTERNLCMMCGSLFLRKKNVPERVYSTAPWLCFCGRVNQSCVCTCACGRNRSEGEQKQAQKTRKPEETVIKRKKLEKPVVPILLENGKEKCPVCGAVQRAERNLCMECGTRFAR